MRSTVIVDRHPGQNVLPSRRGGRLLAEPAQVSSSKPRYERPFHAFRTLRRRRPRIRHHPSRYTAAVDQLPRERRLLRHHLEHGRGVLLLSGCATAETHALPLQQRARRCREPVSVPPRQSEWKVLGAVVATGPRKARRLHMQARARIHGHCLALRGRRGRDAVLRPSGTNARGVAHAHNQRS
jgi:hypothetical protein